MVAIIIRWNIYIYIKSSLISILRFSVTNFFQCFRISITEMLHYENVFDNFSLYYLMNFFFFLALALACFAACRLSRHMGS